MTAMSEFFGIVLAVLLLLGNAFFVGAEFALISARRDRLEALAEQGKHRARAVIAAGEQLSLMLAGSQLGITICSIGLGRVGEPAVAHLLEKVLDPLGVPDSALHAIGFAVALTIVAVLHILLGELVPKNIAIAGPERSALLLDLPATSPTSPRFCDLDRGALPVEVAALRRVRVAAAGTVLLPDRAVTAVNNSFPTGVAGDLPGAGGGGGLSVFVLARTLRVRRLHIPAPTGIRHHMPVVLATHPALPGR